MVDVFANVILLAGVASMVTSPLLEIAFFGGRK